MCVTIALRIEQLVESDELLSTMKDIASIIPANTPTNEQQRRLSVLSGFSMASVETLNAHFDGSAVAEEPHFLLSLFKSIQDLFVVQFKIFVTHAVVTWLSFTLFGVDFSFSTAFASGVLQCSEFPLLC